MNYEVEEIEHRPPAENLWESKRMQAFRKAGLIGCFNGTRINSQNYKTSLEMMADLGLLGSIEDTEVTSRNYKQKYRIVRGKARA